MLDEMILEYVSDVTEQSEVDLLLAIGESYCKYFSMLCNTDNIHIVQETFVFLEDGETSENIITKIKNVFLKAFDYIRTAFKKLSEFFKKKFVRYSATINNTTNLCNIIAALYESDSFVNEYDVIEEAKMSPELTEALRREEAKKAAVKQQIKDLNSAKKDIYNGLKKNYASEMQRRLLSKDEVRDMVKTIRSNCSNDEFIKFRNEITSIVTSRKAEFEKSLNGNISMIENMYTSMVEANKAEQEFLQNWNLSEKSQKIGEKELELRLELLQKFSSTLGNVLNEIGNTKAFSYDAMKNSLYGTGGSIPDILSTIGKEIAGILPKIISISKLGNMGERLYKAHKDFEDAVFEDDMKRKDLGLKTNKSIKAILFALNQIKEESYGYTDDKMFNKIAYDSDNVAAAVIAGYLGGPFTILFTTLRAILHGPAALAFGIKDIAMYAGFRSMSHGLNQKRAHIVSNKEALDNNKRGKHMMKAIEDLPHDEKMDVIRKLRDEEQKAYDDKSLAKRK